MTWCDSVGGRKGAAMTQYVGLDISPKETKLHVLDEAGNRVWRERRANEPAAIG